MLEGVWIIVGTAKIFAEQNGDHGLEILDSAPFDATHGLLPCYNRDFHVIIGISPRPNGLGEIPYRPRPIPSGWLTTQVSGDRA